MKVEIKENREPWIRSRRLWGALLSAIVAGTIAFYPEMNEPILAVAGAIAAGLGIDSWVRPKLEI